MDLMVNDGDSTSTGVIAKTASWTSLPVELRQYILAFVASPIFLGQYRMLGIRELAEFATVCSEWQAFFEARTFRRLVLDPESLHRFDKAIKRREARLGYVRKLWLRVRLSMYECPESNVPENRTTQYRNNAIFTKCIQSLLETLKIWDPARHGPEGLALMLSASSPSDIEHGFHQGELDEYYPYHYVEDLDLAPGTVDYHLIHRLELALDNDCYCYGSLPSLGGHIKRRYGTPLRLETGSGERGHFIREDSNLPAVPVVKGLVLRRQFRREIHVPTLSSLLFQSFVGLEWFRFERTVSREAHKQTSFDEDLQSYLLPALPETLRQFSFTQWETPRWERKYYFEESGSVSHPDAQTSLPREMAKLCLRLEHFCPPWQMDIASFLQSITELETSSMAPASPLRRIILRCLLSSTDRSGHDFEAFVTLAAKAALSLPCLEVMELWGTCVDGEESLAYIFRYNYEAGRAKIVWRSCEEAPMAKARIIAGWNDVAQNHSCSDVIYDAVPFAETKQEIFRSEGTCIYQHLLLKDLMLDPMTRILLEKENNNLDGAEDGDPSQQGYPPAFNYAGSNRWMTMY